VSSMCELPRKHPTWRRKRARAIAENVDSTKFLNKIRTLAAKFRRMFWRVRRLRREAIFPNFFQPVSIEFAALILADQPGWFGDCAMKPVRIRLPWENMFHVSVLLLPRWFLRSKRYFISGYEMGRTHAHFIQGTSDDSRPHPRAGRLAAERGSRIRLWRAR